jgi:hypothetical protein
MPTTYSPGLQRLSELPGFTLVQAPCVVPGGLAVVGRPSCASTTELDAIMTMAKTTNFVCGFTPAPLPLAISLRLPAKLSRPMLAMQIIQTYFDTSFCLRLCKSGRLIENPRWVTPGITRGEHNESAYPGQGGHSSRPSRRSASGQSRIIAARAALAHDGFWAAIP